VKVLIGLHDGRTVNDDAAQLTMHIGNDTPVMLAFVGSVGEILASHCRESEWSEFLTDAGVNTPTIVTQGFETLRAKIIGIRGGVVDLPCIKAFAYSDIGDPVIGVVMEKRQPDFCHCGERRWAEFCKQHNIFIPRTVEVSSI